MNISKSHHRSEKRSKNAWAVILAGGDGLPIRGKVPAQMRGQRPRHFCRTDKSDFIINQTREYVARTIPRKRTIFTVSENHFRYSQEVLDRVPARNIVVEPQDDGTTFAMLYSLLRIRHEEPDAVVAFFPAELDVPDADSFMDRVRDAIEIAEKESRLVLLGIEPTSFDARREWIEPDHSSPIGEDTNVLRLHRYRDVVSPAEARELTKHGGLWHSSVIVGTIPMFLRTIRLAEPNLYSTFMAAEERIGQPGERMAMRRIYYGNFTESDFSRDVLAKSDYAELAVVRVPAAKVKAAGRVFPRPVAGRSARIPNRVALAASA